MVAVAMTVVSGCAGQFSARGGTDLTGPRVTIEMSGSGGDRQLDYSGDIDFDFDADTLKNDPETRLAVDALAVYLAKHDDLQVVIEGHTDSRGDADHNRRLAQRRAVALRDRLISQGVDGKRLKAIGKGEAAPVVAEPPECRRGDKSDPAACEEKYWKPNRRARFVVTTGKDVPREAGAQRTESRRDPEPTDRHRIGFHVNALGPTGYDLVSGGFAIEMMPALEMMLDIGGGTANSTEGDATVAVKGSRKTTMGAVRARLWLGGRHAFVIDSALGAVHHSVSMSATEPNGDFAYTKEGTVPFAAAGIGYGFRSDGAFRLAAILGVSSTISSIRSGDATGSLPAAEVANLRAICEDGFAPLSKAHPYGELSLGWLF